MTARSMLRGARTAACGSSVAASIGFALLVFAAVFLSLAIPRASLGGRTRALHDALAAAPTTGTSVIGNIDYTTYDSSFYDSPLVAGDLAASRADLAANLAGHQLPLRPPADWSGLASGPVTVAGAAARAYSSGIPPQLEFLYRDPLSRYGRLTLGRLPALGRGAARHFVLQIAVTAATAARFGLRPGSRLALGSGVSAQVTGIIRPADPGSAFWTVDSLAAGPQLVLVAPQRGLSQWFGAAFISPAELPLMQAILPTDQMQLSWDFPLSTAHATVSQVGGLEARLSGAVSAGGLLVSSVRIPTPVTLSSGLITVLAQFSAEDQAVGSVLGLLFVSLTAIGIVVILLGAGLLAARRGAEFAVLRARGASLRQVAGRALGAAAALSLPAAAAGGGLAVVMTPADSLAIAWWLAGCALAAALAGLPLIAVGRLRGAERGSRRRHGAGLPPRRAAAVRRLVAEGALVAAAAGGIIVLRRQGLAAGTVDLYSSAAPALVAIPAAIVVVRGYPAVLRLLLRLAGARPGVSAFVGLARATRTSLTAIVPVFALVLALAVVAFGAMVGDAVHRGQVSVSWRDTGADAVIDASGSPRPLSPAVQRQIAAVPGAARTATVSLLFGTLRGGTHVTIAAVSPARYAALIAGTPGPAFPAAPLARADGAARGAPPGSAVPALVSPAVAAALARGAVPLQIGTRKLEIRVAGSIGSVPGVTAAALVVLPDWALGPSGPAPSLMLVVGPGLDGGALTVAVRRVLPGAVLRLRSQTLAALTGAPLPHAAQDSIAQSAAAAAAFSALILLISLLITARARDLTLARLATMGLRRGQARWLALLEMLPQVLAATVGGVASAWVLAPLVGPAIDLSAFTGTGAGVPIRTEPVPLAACAAGLVLLSVLALAAQSAITGRRGAARSLRVGD